MAPSDHALLSASGAHRWLNCTPSARLESDEPESTSAAAEQGTAAHEVSQVFFRLSGWENLDYAEEI